MSATELTDEMSDVWVRALADRIESGGYEVHDAHESAVVIILPDTARAVLGAADDEEFLVIGWGEAGAHWGLSSDGGATIAATEPLPGTDPIVLGARALRLLTYGRPRQLRHAVPYIDPGPACVCPTTHPCGGIEPADACPEHGASRTPAMAWHWEGDCSLSV